MVIGLVLLFGSLMRKDLMSFIFRTLLTSCNILNPGSWASLLQHTGVLIRPRDGDKGYIGNMGATMPCKNKGDGRGKKGSPATSLPAPSNPNPLGVSFSILDLRPSSSTGGKWGRPRWGGGLPASPPQWPDRVLALRNAWLHLPPFPPPVLSSKASERHPAGVLEKTKPPSRNGTRLSASPAVHPEAGGRAGG